MRTLYFVSLILFANCTLKNELTKKVDIDPVFLPYVQDFLNEAERRGSTISLEETGLTLKFGAIPNYNGFCYYASNRVIIDEKEWNLFSSHFKSWLIFHELGHCILERQHQNDLLINGEWKSLMRGTPFTGIAPSYLPVPFFGFRRTYYLDELFNPSTRSPEWAFTDFNYNDVPLEKKSIFFETSNQPIIHQKFNTSPTNHELEMKLTLPPSPNFAQIVWGDTLLSYSINLNPVQGYRILVHQGSPSTLLYVNPNLSNYNGKAIEKITIRQHQGFVQIFLNDVFSYLIDELPNPLQFVRIEYSDARGVLSSNFNIPSFKYYQLTD